MAPLAGGLPLSLSLSLSLICLPVYVFLSLPPSLLEYLCGKLQGVWIDPSHVI
jgi:hypothetical protein